MITYFGLRQSRKGLDEENRKEVNEILRWRGDLFNINCNDVPLQISTVKLFSVYPYLGLTWTEVRENDPIV